MEKKQNTKPVDIFAGEGSTADRLKKQRELKQKRLEEITGIKQPKKGK